MKRLKNLKALFLIILILFSCKKEDEYSIIGKWEIKEFLFIELGNNPRELYFQSFGTLVFKKNETFTITMLYDENSEPLPEPRIENGTYSVIIEEKWNSSIQGELNAYYNGQIYMIQYGIRQNNLDLLGAYYANGLFLRQIIMILSKK